MRTPFRLNYGLSGWDLLRSMELAGISLRESRYTAGMVLPAHSHLRVGFHLLLRGQYTEITAESRTTFEPRCLAYLPAGHEHSVQFGNNGARSFCIELEPRWLTALDGEAALPKGSLCLEKGPAPALIQRILQEFDRTSSE